MFILVVQRMTKDSVGEFWLQLKDQTRVGGSRQKTPSVDFRRGP